MVGRVLPTAMCVRGVDDLCVLQFTLIIAAGCALHRRTSRVIHRIELCFLGFERRRGQLPTCFHAGRRLSLSREGRRGTDLRRCERRGTPEGLRDAIDKQRAEGRDDDDASLPGTTAGTSDPLRMATRVALTPRSDPLTLREGCRAPGKMLRCGSIQACRPGPLPCRSIRPVRTQRERHT